MIVMPLKPKVSGKYGEQSGSSSKRTGGGNLLGGIKP